MSPKRRGTLRTWLVGAGAIFAVAFGAYFGINPSLGPISLTTAWQRRIIVPGASGAGNPDGADGVAWLDISGDGLPDVVSGHEQGLRITLSLHPGLSGLLGPDWPTVILPTVNMCSAEDAQMADIDADGAIDIVAGCETGSSLIEIYFAPDPPNTAAELLNAANWTRVQVTTATQRSMRVIPFDIQGDAALELVVGGKEGSSCGPPPVGEADVGYYASATPRTGGSWAFTEIEPVGWTQQVELVDVDGDTDTDIIYTDYDPINCPALDNSRRGLRWLESDGLDPPGFTAHPISAVEGNHRWFSVYDWDGDSDLDVLDCESLTGPPPTTELRWMLNNGDGSSWATLPLPTIANVGSCIDTEIADLDDDGDQDIAVSFSHAEDRSGIVWLSRDGPPLTASYQRGEVTGNIDSDSDVKFDNLVALDVDSDGDLDLASSEQHVPAGTGPGLGVLYYENPLHTFVAPPAPAAVDCVALTSGVDSTAGTTAVTASVSPGGDRLILAAFASALAGGPAAPSGLDGNGLTWVQVNSVPYNTSNTRRVSVFRALGASPSAGAITATWAASQTSKTWAIIECAGVDTSGSDGAGAVVQSVTQTAAAASTTLTATLAALEAATSAHVSFVSISINNATTPDGDFLELSDVSSGTGAHGLESAWATNQVAVTPTFASAAAGAISVEVRISP